jgi:hypothetical protein
LPNGEGFSVYGGISFTGNFPCLPLRVGSRHRVRRGALEGLEGTLIKNKSEWRVVVSVTMLDGSVWFKIDRQ